LFREVERESAASDALGITLEESKLLDSVQCCIAPSSCAPVYARIYVIILNFSGPNATQDPASCITPWVEERKITTLWSDSPIKTAPTPWSEDKQLAPNLPQFKQAHNVTVGYELPRFTSLEV
jgi:hypothetical protein